MANNKRLIEEWMPIKEIGIESRRERAASSALPALYFLHVWWARRPLIASRAAILGALLPAWDGNDEILGKHFPNREEYYIWFKRMLGILGDPVAARQAQDSARAAGIRLKKNPFDYPRAFTVVPDQSEFTILENILKSYLGNSKPSVLDSMAGGGSIPLESLRMGFKTTANELNPVACVILKSTIEYPLTLGKELLPELEHWGRKIDETGRARLSGYFPSQPGEQILDYLWARTVPCPSTGKPVPLSPNWWLRRQTDDSVAVNLLPCESPWLECRFELVEGTQQDLQDKYSPDRGTISRGNAISPWTGDPVPGDYIKEMAQTGRMDAQLYALCIDRGAGREFRLPTEDDLVGGRKAEAALKRHWDKWMANGLIPSEGIKAGEKTKEPISYGMDNWYKLYSPRQLFAHLTYLETLRNIMSEIRDEYDSAKADAICTYLGIVLDKTHNFNSILASWIPQRQVIRSTFDEHNYAIKWTFAEMNMALKDKGAFPWALSQIIDAYKGLCSLLEPSRPLFRSDEWGKRSPAQVRQGNGATLTEIPDASIDSVVVDPPYGGNVMYAELSDFFYVWMKRSIGDIYPEWFQAELTAKDSEAVANTARFKDAKGGRPRDFAAKDYMLKMRRVFREMRRVVKPEGSMVVMFTHRETDMWNSLGLALLDTGWEIGSSWPVNTEFEYSLHQAQKNAARSTILLYCKPRPTNSKPSFWEQSMVNEVRSTARTRAREYQEQGIDGVDLYLATYGPVLGVLSGKWPLLSPEVDRETGEPVRMEPEEALRIARREVFALRREQLLEGRAASWDSVTEWYILAWDAFKARVFPFDDARKLAIASGIEVTDLIKNHRLLSKKGNSVSFNKPGEREGNDLVNPRSGSFTRMVDALHTAMWIYQLEGERECRRFLENTALLNDSDFSALVEAAIKAIPRGRKYQHGQIVGFLVEEAETLENMRVSLFPDIEAPVEGTDDDAEQGSLF